MQADNTKLFTEMQAVRGFILYRTQPNEKGGTDKIPVSPHGQNLPIDPHDDRQWMLPHEAQAHAARLGFGVGLVISENICFPGDWRIFCLDLDKCRDGNGWAPHAAAFVSRFPGAYMEVSISGNGLHVFGLYHGPRPDHGSKNADYGMELYTRLRFIALCGVNAQGSIFTDHTVALHQLAAEYFPPKPEGVSDELTKQPVAEWVGPTNDDELLKIALASQTNPIKGGAPFRALYNRDFEVLMKHYGKSGSIDESAADLALATSLVFFTGGDGERIQRIMERPDCKLRRSKWDREDYLPRTIAFACGTHTGSYYASKKYAPDAKPPPPPPVVDANGGIVPDAEITHGEILGLNKQVSKFAGCTYIEEVVQIMTPKGKLLNRERFDNSAEFAGHPYVLDAHGKVTRSPWEAFVKSEIYKFPKVDAMCFYPQRKPQEIIYRENRSYINTYIPLDIKRVKGDASPFLNHVKKLLPNGRDAEQLLAYMAACVQHQGVKFKWWPLIQGTPGNGKTLITKVLKYAIGNRYSHIAKSAELTSRFNSAFYGKILVVIDDINLSEIGETAMDTLKPMITDPELEIEAKGVDKVTREICFNGIMTTNHKNGVRKTMDDRRVAPFFTAQQSKAELIACGMDAKYFIALNHWLDNQDGKEIVADWLFTWEIPAELNPATNVLTAPETSSTSEAVREGLGQVEQEILAQVDQKANGFRSGWISSTYVDRLIANLGKSTFFSRNRKRNMMQSLGYAPHPALKDGVAPVPDTDGSTPILYVRPDAPGSQQTDVSLVMPLYRYAQDNPL